MSSNKRKLIVKVDDNVTKPKTKTTKVEKTKNFKCDVCEKRFSHGHILRDHHRVHTGEKPFKCTECDKSFTQRSSLLVHRRFHTGEKPYQCDICEKRFYQNSALKSHKLNHSIKNFECDVCNKKFLLEINLQLHKKRIHCNEEEKETHICKYCNKILSFKPSLDRHMRKHTLPYKCNVCAASFASTKAYNKHKACHEKNSTGKFHCRYCYLAFPTLIALKWHHQSHASRYRQICNFCGVRFPRIASLKNHITKKHLSQFKFEKCNLNLQSEAFLGIQPKNPLEISHATEFSKNFKCQFCTASFTIEKALDWHNQSHWPENPFRCAKCGWKFRNQTDLEAHLALPPHNSKAYPILKDDRRSLCIWNLLPTLPVAKNNFIRRTRSKRKHVEADSTKNTSVKMTSTTNCEPNSITSCTIYSVIQLNKDQKIKSLSMTNPSDLEIRNCNSLMSNITERKSNSTKTLLSLNDDENSHNSSDNMDSVDLDSDFSESDWSGSDIEPDNSQDKTTMILRSSNKESNDQKQESNDQKQESNDQKQESNDQKQESNDQKQESNDQNKESKERNIELRGSIEDLKIGNKIKREAIADVSKEPTPLPVILIGKIKLEVDDESFLSKIKTEEIDEQTQYQEDKKLTITSKTFQKNNFAINNNFQMGIPNNILSLAPRAIVSNGIKVEVCCNTNEMSDLKNQLPRDNKELAASANNQIFHNGIKVEASCNTSPNKNEINDVQDALKIENTELAMSLQFPATFQNYTTVIKDNKTVGFQNNISSITPRTIVPNGIKVEVCCDAGIDSNIEQIPHGAICIQDTVDMLRNGVTFQKRNIQNEPSFSGTEQNLEVKVFEGAHAITSVLGSSVDHLTLKAMAPSGVKVELCLENVKHDLN